MRPPSPANRTFVGERLNTSASPNPPTIRSPCREPNACAASNTSRMPRSSGDVVQLLDTARRAEDVGRQDRRGPHADRSADGVRRQGEGVGVDVREDRAQPVPGDGVRGGGERERRDHDVPGEIRRPQDEHQSGRAGGDGHAMADPEISAAAPRTCARGRPFVSVPPAEDVAARALARARDRGREAAPRGCPPRAAALRLGRSGRVRAWRSSVSSSVEAIGRMSINGQGSRARSPAWRKTHPARPATRTKATARAMAPGIGTAADSDPEPATPGADREEHEGGARSAPQPNRQHVIRVSTVTGQDRAPGSGSADGREDQLESEESQTDPGGDQAARSFDHEAARLRREHDPDPVRPAVPEEQGGGRRVPQQEDQEAATDGESDGEPGLGGEELRPRIPSTSSPARRVLPRARPDRRRCSPRSRTRAPGGA